MKIFTKTREFLFGSPLDPLQRDKKKNIFLVSFLAWIGLGADGLSSSCYGPEEAFIALGSYSSQLGLYLAVATALTVFIIALSYNQVIELFPTGGGGYKVATTLLNPYAGLVSGVALIIDYILTITISIASCVDALFSLISPGFQPYKWIVETVLILLLMFLNLRGAKESIKILMPIFLGFFISHVVIIILGIVLHADQLPEIIPTTLQGPVILSNELGWVFVVSLFLKAYSLGGGTYTGIEAVSNNVNMLAEPRVRTGKITMTYMAVSLSLMAGGLILLYLLWKVTPIYGQTLNATTFDNILQQFPALGRDYQVILLTLLLAFEAFLLFIAANTGFLGGPAVLANLAVDSWAPSYFRFLSARLVTENGIIFMGFGALLILLLTRGKVSVLVVMYSINVFITFTLSLLGLTRHWWQSRHTYRWIPKISLSLLGFIVSASILCITIFEKFSEGAWFPLLVALVFVIIGILIRNHYKTIDKEINETFSKEYEPRYFPTHFPPVMDKNAPTAVILIGKGKGLGMHTLHKIQTLFPNLYKNFVFLGVGEIDYSILGKEPEVSKLRKNLIDNLRYFVNYCHHLNLPATYEMAFGADIIETTEALSEKIKEEFPSSVFFAGEIVFENESWLTKWLHDHAPVMIQQALHPKGIQVVLLPMVLRI